LGGGGDYKRILKEDSRADNNMSTPPLPLSP